MIQVDLIRKHIERYLAQNFRIYVSCLPEPETEVLQRLTGPNAAAVRTKAAFAVMSCLGYEVPPSADVNRPERGKRKAETN